MIGAGAFQVVHLDIPVTGGATQRYVSLGMRGRIISYTITHNVALTVADAVLALKIGGVAVTGGGKTIDQASSSIGKVETVTPTALRDFDADEAIEIESDGGATAGNVGITLVIGAQGDGTGG